MLILPINNTRYANVPFTHQAVETLCNLSVPNESDQYQNENCHSSIFSYVLIVNTECSLKPVSSPFSLERLCSKKRKESGLLERIYFPGLKSWLGGHRQKFILEINAGRKYHVSSCFQLSDTILGLHVTSEMFPYLGIRHVGVPPWVKFTSHMFICHRCAIITQNYNGFFGKGTCSFNK